MTRGIALMALATLDCLVRRSTSRSTAAPTLQPTRLRTVTAAAGGQPGRRYPAGPPPASRFPGRRRHGTFPITGIGELHAPAVRTSPTWSPTPAGGPASRRAPRKADRQILSSQRLTLTEPTHAPGQKSAVITVETAEQSASLASTPIAAMTVDRTCR